MERPSPAPTEDPAGQNDPAPSSSSYRVFSCRRCTRRKQRCDKVLPTCTPCHKSGSDCTSSDREANVVQGIHQEVTRKGVVTTLLERIAALKGELEDGGDASVQQQSASDIRFPDTEVAATRARDAPLGAASDSLNLGLEHAHIATSALPSTAAAAAAVNSPAQGPAAVEEPDMNMNLLSLSAVAEPSNRAGEFLKHLSTPRLIAGVTETFGGNPELTARVNPLWEGISQYIRHPAGAAQRLHIPRDEALKALDTYLNIVDFRFPRLPVAKVQAGIDAISATDDDEAAYSEALSRNPAHIFMAYLVVAIVPLVSDAYPISQASWVSVHLLSKCLKLLSRVFNEEDGVDIIQCLHLLIVLSIHCSTAGSAWHLVGFAMNKCIALGYHRREDPHTLASLSTSEVQQRRCAFWGCYLLDRLVCAALGRPFSIDDQDISVPLPEAESLSRTPNGGSLGGEGQSPFTPLLVKEQYHVHLFRYAILLSSAAQEGPVLADGVGDAGFDSLLGHALYWRTTAPKPTDPSVSDIHSHQTSLYNTLLLRIAIRDIGRGFTFISGPKSDLYDDEGHQRGPNLPETAAQVNIQHHLMPGYSDGDGNHVHSTYQYRPDSVESAQVFACEQDRIRRINLFGICRAVSQSLDRTRMVGRPYLSFLTGYSALSMGLACLYYLVVTAPTARQDPDGSMPPSLGIATTGSRTCSFSRGNAEFNNHSSPPSSIDSHRQGSNGQQAQWRLQRRIYHDPQTIIDLACQKLEIVGRQFPRLQEYRMILEKLRYLVCMWPMRFQMCTQRPSLEDEVVDLRKAINGIGPTHLKLLAAAVVYVLTLT